MRPGVAVWLGTVLWLVAGSPGGTLKPGLPAAAAQGPAPPLVRVLQPDVRAPLTAHPVLLRGVVQPPDPDLRVTVDGRPAFMIQGGEWAILRDLPAGTHTLLVEGRARGQVVSRADLRVAIAGPRPIQWPLQFRLGPLAAAREIEREVLLGLAPFEWQFRLDVTSGVANGQLDPEGAGGRPHELRAGEVYTHPFRSPGFYGPTLRYADPTGRAVVQQGLIVVFDRAWLESVLRARWAEFLATVDQDPERGTALVDAIRRRYFSVMLQAAPPGDWPKWVALLREKGPLVLESVVGRTAVSKLANDPKGPEIEFVLDPADGRWYYYVR